MGIQWYSGVNIHGLTKDSSPLGIFHEFVPIDLIMYIKEQTNLYAGAHQKKWYETDFDEVMAVLTEFPQRR